MKPRLRNQLLAGIALFLIAFIAVVYAMGKPYVSKQPLDLKSNGVHGIYNLHNKQGQLVLYNFRAVEPDVLYRGSGFPHNRNPLPGERHPVTQAAMWDDTTFRFLRQRNIHIVVRLERDDEPWKNDYFGERDYFKNWSKQTGYNIKLVKLPIKAGHGYDRNDRNLAEYEQYADRRTGLRAAGEFIAMMKQWKPADGAIYLHCDAGKDRTGVVVAAYELWRNQGVVDRDTLWDQVMKRYLVSNLLIPRDREAPLYAGEKNACGAAEAPNYVCSGWLNGLRPQLEKIAQL